MSEDPSPTKDPQHHLRRLDHDWTDSSIYFLTTNVTHPTAMLATEDCAEILVSEWQGAAARHGWGVGHYVIMPDHVHFFAAPSREAVALSRFMQAWKEWTSKRICRALHVSAPLWQSEFFDHLLRSFESYEEKSRYVLENPVRAGLVERLEDWPFHGKVGDLHLWD